MVAESVDAKIFKIGSVVFEIWPFYHITLWSAIVSITKNEHDETTYTKVWNAETALSHYCCLDMCDHLPGQMLDH